MTYIQFFVLHICIGKTSLQLTNDAEQTLRPSQSPPESTLRPSQSPSESTLDDFTTNKPTRRSSSVIKGVKSGKLSIFSSLLVGAALYLRLE